MRSFVLALIIAALAVFTSAAPVALSEDLDNILGDTNVDSVLGSLGDGGSGITRRDGPTSAIVKRGFGAFAASVNARNLLDGLDTELGNGSLTDSLRARGYFSASTILEKLKGISHSPRAVTGGLSTDTDSVSSSISARNVVDDLEGELTDVLQSRALSVDTIKGKLGNLTNKLGHGNV